MADDIMNSSTSDIMTAKEVAQRLRVSERTVLDWAQKGKIPAGKVGSVWRFEKGEIDRWLKTRLSPRNVDIYTPVPIGEVLSPERVIVLEGQHAKADVLEMLIDALACSPFVKNRDELREAVFRREQLMSTGIGLGVAIPHVRIASVSRLVMAAAACPDGIANYESLDGEAVRIVYMVAAGLQSHAEYIRLVSSISQRIKDEPLRKRLLSCRSSELFYEMLAEGKLPGPAPEKE